MSVIDKELLELLACPETHQPLTVADASQLETINQRIAAGGCTNIGGATVETPIEAGLVRKDGKVLYAIRDTIPVLLVNEGFAL